ncbi:hypothetical protein M422DRAFT_52999 [Sphaerobolus stellatus SS14]|uniref:Transcription factor domain-containing protein n=1 Tax=Sphaerobolus stellatus (strain SS14) TaxID=990650 RepID=A0A0C9UBT1_SPHS4|nr:hypothetical protein M422DRAFT_52999 [Sphaerobolus stellatus SS14]
MSNGSSSKSKKSERLVSCAECRRVWPCSACSRRGLAALCPHGNVFKVFYELSDRIFTVALSTRPRKQLNQTPRSKNPPTLSINPESESTTKINELKSRIKELEDALGTLQTIHGRDMGLLNEEEEDQDVDNLNEMLGTLKVDRDSGSTHFFGHPGGIEDDLETEGGRVDPKWHIEPSTRHIEPYDGFRDISFSPTSLDYELGSVQESLEAHLPPVDHARTLYENYYTFEAWFYTVIPRKIFEEKIFNPIYATSPPSLQQVVHTDICIIFMVFSVGTLAVPSLPDSIERQELEKVSARYHQLGKAALSAGPSSLVQPTIAGIRCIFIMSVYYSTSDYPLTSQTVWALLYTAMGHAINI